MLKVPKGAQALTPRLVQNLESQYVAVVTTEGYLLLFPVADLPELPKGKGNKMIHIPTRNKTAERSVYCIAVMLLNENSHLTVYSGKRYLTLSPHDLESFHGERGKRGRQLPKGFHAVDSVGVDT